MTRMREQIDVPFDYEPTGPFYLAITASGRGAHSEHLTFDGAMREASQVPVTAGWSMVLADSRSVPVFGWFPSTDQFVVGFMGVAVAFDWLRREGYDPDRVWEWEMTARMLR